MENTKICSKCNRRIALNRTSTFLKTVSSGSNTSP